MKMIVFILLLVGGSQYAHSECSNYKGKRCIKLCNDTYETVYWAREYDHVGPGEKKIGVSTGWEALQPMSCYNDIPIVDFSWQGGTLPGNRFIFMTKDRKWEWFEGDGRGYVCAWLRSTTEFNLTHGQHRDNSPYYPECNLVDGYKAVPGYTINAGGIFRVRESNASKKPSLEKILDGVREYYVGIGKKYRKEGRKYAEVSKLGYDKYYNIAKDYKEAMDAIDIVARADRSLKKIEGMIEGYYGYTGESVNVRIKFVTHKVESYINEKIRIPSEYLEPTIAGPSEIDGEIATRSFLLISMRGHNVAMPDPLEKLVGLQEQPDGVSVYLFTSGGFITLENLEKAVSELLCENPKDRDLLAFKRNLTSAGLVDFSKDYSCRSSQMKEIG
ncbi:hypothetical protein [Hahella sp. NBU794]|uniref:hypothetical protein n=1 Tax=Hahella sp. NBU794 TaxID=3422590 RepID=UPI003D6E5A80